MAISNGQITDIMYQYIVDGTSMENIGHGYGMSAGEISNILEPYHFGGAENKSGRGGFSSGTNRGRYASGVNIEDGNGEVIHYDIDFDVLQGYVNAVRNIKGRKPTLEEYLAGGVGGGFELPGIFSKILMGIAGIFVIIILVALVAKLFGGHKDSGIVGSSGQGPFSGPFSGISSYFSNGYEIEAYEMGNWVYIGNKKRNKPNGINFRYTNHTNAEYDLANFSDDKLSGEGVSYDMSHNFYVGVRKKNEYKKSWVIVNKNNGNEVILAYYKNGEPKGAGIVYDGAKTSIVDFSKDKKEIASYYDGGWKKPNGKKFKLKKDNKYKGIECLDDMNFIVDGIRVCINPSNLKYESETFSFEGIRTKFDVVYTMDGNKLDFSFDDSNRVYMLYTKEDGSDQGVDVALTVTKKDEQTDTSDDDSDIFDPLGVQDTLDDIKEEFGTDEPRKGDGYTVNEDGSLTLDSGITVTFGDD